MTIFDFPGGAVALDPGRVWVELELFRVNGGQYTLLGTSEGGIVCTLRKGRDVWVGRSKLGPADAAANALEASQKPPPLTRADG